MMLGLATATIVESSRIMKKPTIMAHTATQGLAACPGFIGFVVISKVPNTLHTPLMSGTNAIHGIVVVGGLLLLGLPGLDGLSKALLVVAVAFGTINVVGGFLVTDRMLEMFKSKPKPRADAEADHADASKRQGSPHGDASDGGKP